jgi:hypothetical protein
LDGGNSNPDIYLIPYLQKMMGPGTNALHFDYIILSHFHQDHYKGLTAIKNGKITADTLIDPGGYKYDDVFGGRHPAVETPPTSMDKPDAWLSALTTAAHHQPKFIKDHSRLFASFGTTGKTGIGKTLTLGMVGGHPVTLQCVAGWGNTLAANGITANPTPSKSNANNFTISFILTLGEFRYYLGGDMGGSNDGAYIDQETPLLSYLPVRFPNAHPFSSSSEVNTPGHLCGFKASHHGSDHSNEEEFITSMHASITVTSAGSNNSWHLPSISFLERLAAVTPLTPHAQSEEQMQSAHADTGMATALLLPSARGIYFTNLYDFSGGNNSLDKANTLFANKPGISYDYGNNSNNRKGGYLIKITDAAGIATNSSFEAGRVDINNNQPYQRLATFNCHR